LFVTFRKVPKPLSNLLPPLIVGTKRRKSFTTLWKRKSEGRKR